MERGNAFDNDRESLLTAWVDRYQGMLLRLCYVYLCDSELAQDAVQETFLKAYRGMKSFRGECSEKTWLIRIAVNTCRSMCRSAWFRHVDRRVTPEDVPWTVTMAESNETDVLRDVMRLPVKLKEVILLYYWQDMRMHEIAQSLGVTQSTVSHRLKRAREKLRDVLNRRGYNE